MSLPQDSTVQYGDLVMFVGKDEKPLIRTVRQGEKFQIRQGEIDFDALVGMPFGSQYKTHRGHGIFVLQPSLDDFLTYIRRNTQIIFPKDLGYIALKMGLRQGMRVIEAGSGSGALTSLLALMVGDSGQVFSYERRAGNLSQAEANVKRLGLDHRVSFFERDIAEGFEQSDVDAVFLDLPEIPLYLPIAREVLVGGGFFGAIVPTVNQLVEVVGALHAGDWFLIQAEELLRRTWKTTPQRVRPDDQMYGHTGFLIFARAVEALQKESLTTDGEEN